MKFISVLATSTAIVFAAFDIVNAAAASNSSLNFTYNATDFLLDGKPFQMFAGQMDPQRIPHQYWRDRLQKARAMGLNSISSYIFWDQLETTKGNWNFTGENDVAQYFKIAQEEGLKILLRPGSYICGEHAWGGFPAWLMEEPGMVVRSSNKPFLAATKAYITRLAQELKPLLASNGGPIVLVQVENEYGSYGDDHQYTEALRDMWKAAGFNVPLYTNDGAGQSYLDGGVIPNVLAEVDGGGGDPQSAFAQRNKYTNRSSLGPLLDGEYYTTWLDLWGSDSPHQVTSASGAKTVVSDLAWIMNNKSSFSLYMFHGGTNFGFQAGADWSTVLTPVTTSYDYGAPLDESGRPNKLFYDIQKTIQAYVGNSTVFPGLPKETPMVAIPSVKMTPMASLFNSLPKPVKRKQVINMEALGQADGYILYRTISSKATNGTLALGDYPRDRVLVYVNGKRQGLFDATYPLPQIVNVNVKANDVLDLLVENQGRINYGPRIPDQRKGIVGNVTLDGKILENWSMYSLPLSNPSEFVSSKSKVSNTTSDSPIFYQGHFNLKTVGDTFLDTKGWTKGVVWVNGYNLGRYWMIGPQQQLYVPGCWLHKGQNEIIIFELENTNSTTVTGVTTRTWGNKPNPDVPITKSS